MSAEGLSQQIELLVNNLRKQDTQSMSLIDVASVTEVLMGTMNAFYRSIDTSIYRECRALAEYISNARKEIASMQPVDLESAGIPRAGLELDAIVQQTEEATNTIMEAAEEIMSADTVDSAKYQVVTQDAVMRIFEACSFQDITGQRISKVVETLSHIETRVTELRNLMGVTDADIEEARQSDPEPTGDDALLSGPALDGEGINQSAVDELMDGDSENASSATEALEKPPEASAPKAVSAAELDAMFDEDIDPIAEAKAKNKGSEPKKETKPQKEKDAALPENEDVSQDDIDALFP